MSRVLGCQDRRDSHNAADSGQPTWRFSPPLAVITQLIRGARTDTTDNVEIARSSGPLLSQ